VGFKLPDPVRAEYDEGSAAHAPTIFCELTLMTLSRSLCCSLTLIGSLLVAGARAAEPELVGLLALAVKEDVAKELGFSAELQKSLLDLADKREMGGVGQALAAQSLERDARLAKLAPYRAESEAQMFALLSDEQRAKLEALREKQSDAAFKTTVWSDGAEPVQESEAKPEEPAVEPPSPNQSGPNDSEPRNDELPVHNAVETAKPQAANGKLTINFRFQPWKEVIDWYAQQAGLSLVLESPPPGTFNYQDTREYTPTEALDVLNSVLLTKGYTLVRKGRMLLVVNLEDGIPPNLVTDVPLAELEARGEYELVRVLFRVRGMTPEEAAAELQSLVGPQGSIVVLAKAGMIQVTETAGRIRTIRDVIEAIDDPVSATGEIRQYQLKHALVDDLLPVLRPMLGIPDQTLAAADGSLQLAPDLVSNKLLAQGKRSTLARLDELVKMLDIPDPTGANRVAETPQLEVYPVTGSDPAAVLAVLQTLMAGSELTRLATDPATGNLVALATPTQHATIRATLLQMQQDARQIEVIPLSTVDPQTAVLAISKLFNKSTDPTKPDPLAPTIDADLSTNTLLVRASPAQITQIRDLLKQMGDSGEVAVGSRGNVRMIPLSGSEIESALSQLEKVWPTIRPNKIRVVTPSSTIPSYRPGEQSTPAADEADSLMEELLRELPAPRDRGANSGKRVRAVFAAETTAAPEEDPVAKPQAASKPSVPGAPIVIAPGANGTIISSDDLEALDEFERLLSSAVSTSGTSGRQFAVFYLKYAEANTAAAVLGKVFGGSSGGTGGSLLGDIAGAAVGQAGGGLMGDLLGLGGAAAAGSGFTSAGVSIVPDLRLNALIVYALQDDLDTVDQLLRILDQRIGPEKIEAGGKARLIPVYNTSATAVATVVKEVYKDRLEGSGGGGGGGGQPNPEEFMRMMRGAMRGGDAASAEPEPDKMSIGIDERSNSLVVRASDPLFEQVEALVKQLDEEGLEKPQATQVVRLKGTNSAALKSAITSLLGDKVKTSSSMASTDAPQPPQPNQAEQQRREEQQQAEDRQRDERRREFFRRMIEMQQQGGGGDRGGRGGRGGPPGR
jgi:type II secretory pathway component GspD/PulD (secretin)